MRPAAVRSPSSPRLEGKASSEAARRTESSRAAAGPTDARRLERRFVYVGEGLTLDLVSTAALSAEVVDMTPEGLGIAILGTGPLPSVGEIVAIEHTGRVTAGIRQEAVVRSISKMRVGGRMLPRIGVWLVADRTSAPTTERRRLERHACPEGLPAMASATCPLFFREWLHFSVTQVGAGGTTLKTSLRNKALLVGLELAFTLTLPISGSQHVRGRLTSVKRDGSSREFVVGVAWLDPSRELLNAVSEYLLLGDKGLTPARLREGGLEVGNIERAVTYDYASGPSDHAEIFALRLRAHQAENRLENVSTADMASPTDAHSRHVTCRFGGRIIGYIRVNFVERDPMRSQYVTEGGHAVPEWLWKAGFVEAGAAAIDPEFQRGGLYVALLQHALRVAVQSGHKYLVIGVTDELLPMNQQLGFEVLDTRVVEPKPGWRFRSHMICLGADELTQAPPEGRGVLGMASVVSFVGAGS